MSNYNNELDIIRISELTSWDFPDTKQIPDGYESKSVPEATPENMTIMMDKINELTKTVNELLEVVSGVNYINRENNS